MSFRFLSSHHRDKYKDGANAESAKSERKVQKSFVGKKLEKISRFVREVYTAPADFRRQHTGTSTQKRYEVTDSYKTCAKSDTEVDPKMTRSTLEQGPAPLQTNSAGALDKVKVKVINVRPAPVDATIGDLGDFGDSKKDVGDKITKAGSFS